MGFIRRRRWKRTRRTSNRTKAAFLAWP